MTVSKVSRVSTAQRLAELAKIGPWFSGTVASREFGWDSKKTSQYLWRWSEEKLIKPLGGKSDVYFNLVSSPDSPRTHWEVAVRSAMPDAVLSGSERIRVGGLSTQFGDDELIVPAKSVQYKITDRFSDPVKIGTRNQKWWDAMRDNRCIMFSEPQWLNRLNPTAALVDYLLFETGQMLGPDDIDFDHLAGTKRELNRWRKLLTELGHPDEAKMAPSEAFESLWVASRMGDESAPK
jgi:hypothetical protein